MPGTVSNRIISIVFVAASLASAAAAGRALLAGVPRNDPWLFPMLVVVPACAAAAFALLLFASPGVRANVLLLLAALGLGLYVLDGALALLPVPADPSWEEVARAAGRPFDLRRRFEVVRDLRAAGTQAYPSFGARGLRMLRGREGGTVSLDGRAIAPLAQLRDRLIVDCNESGRFSIFHTDERGFNNPTGSWGGTADLAAVGDSYVQGSCVDPAETLVANLRKGVPRTVGLGLGDSGPLAELGMIKEFLPAVRPADVYWFYYEGNDLRNLSAELHVKELRVYLEPAGTQRLAELQERIDDVLGGYVDEALDTPLQELEERTPEPPPPASRPSLRQWLTLHRTRNALALANLDDRLGRCCRSDSLGIVLREAKRTVESWGGRLHFVYLPAAGRYAHPLSAILDDDLRYRGPVLRMVRRIGLPIVDIDAAFRETGEPAKLYFSARSHFNPDGYRIAARAVLRDLGVTLPPDTATSSPAP